MTTQQRIEKIKFQILQSYLSKNETGRLVKPRFHDITHGRERRRINEEYWSNRDKILARKHKYYSKNREKLLKRNKRWKDTHYVPREGYFSFDGENSINKWAKSISRRGQYDSFKYQMNKRKKPV